MKLRRTRELLEFVLGLGLLEKFFLTCALSGTVVFTIRMILMFSGIIGGASGELDGGDDVGQLDHDLSGSADLADVHDDVSHAVVVDHADSGSHSNIDDSDISFQYLSIQGLTAFFMMFGWVGLALVYDSGFPGWIAVSGAIAAGILTVWLLAQMFRCASSLQCDGTIRVRRALGAGATVYLRIPAQGTGQIQVEIDGRLHVRDAISTSGEEIKTGEQVTVVWVQDNGILVVEKDDRDAGGKLCGR